MRDNFDTLIGTLNPRLIPSYKEMPRQSRDNIETAQWNKKKKRKKRTKRKKRRRILKRKKYPLRGYKKRKRSNSSIAFLHLLQAAWLKDTSPVTCKLSNSHFRDC
jgi:hypothetical protein